MKSQSNLWLCPAILSCLLFFLYGWFREHRALVHAFDTGLYMQILHNLLSNGSWECSVVGEANFLAHHFQPVLLFLVPLFAIWPKASGLFLISFVQQRHSNLKK